MAKFFGIPFGAAASKTTIPNNDGANVSWNGGYTANYEYNPVTDKNAKHVERDVMNTLFYEITSTLRQIQINGISPYYEEIIRTDGPGYGAGALVGYAGQLWRSKVDNNRVVPNASSKDNWEILYGYDTLLTKLKEEGISSGGGNNTGGGYTKAEIDSKLDSITSSFNRQFGDYLYKELGEIFLLGHCGAERQEDGFFICNGDYLPFDPSGANNTGNYFYGNQLYSLCFDDGAATDFKSRWGIDVNSGAGIISLPNMLGRYTEGHYEADNHDIFLTLNRDGAPINTKKPILSEYAAADDPHFAFTTTLVPAIYLGNP